VRQLSEYVARARSLPPQVLLQKVGFMALRKARRTLSRAYYTNQTSYSDQKLSLCPPTFSSPSIDWLEKEWPLIEKLVTKTMDHQFDLLGSGWKQVNRPKSQKSPECEATEVNIANRSCSQRVIQLIDSDYAFIDWHLDFKAGYRWIPSQWWESISYGHQPNVDIKVPWELSRMQYLPWLAYAYHKTKEDQYYREFRNQALDFIANNPPRFGVNWKGPMDVAIRCANWLMALDLFRSAGVIVDKDFERIFANSLFDHGLFIEQNFEKEPDFRSNHYLANIAGLTFVAFALSDHERVGKWQVLCQNELLKEAAHQFHPIGSNFEGSTSYHRLAGELLIYGCLVIEKNRPGFIEGHPSMLRQIKGIGKFSEHCSLPSGEVVQIGDNDNGRFLKLNPCFSKDLVENQLNQRHLQNLVESLFTGTPTSLESSLVANSISLPIGKSDWQEDILKKPYSQKPQHNLKQANQTKTYRFLLPLNYQENLECYFYKDFGLCVFKSKNFFLSFRCGPVGQGGRGGHDHNDQLSIELFADGRHIIRDPGTYVYTTNPTLRNLYRSNKAHFCPQPEGSEMGGLDKGLFFIENATSGELLEFSPKGCLGWHKGFGFPVYRQIHFLPSEVLIEDFFFTDKVILDLNNFNPPHYSPGYGMRIEQPRLKA
jgi:hypothetical protein